MRAFVIKFRETKSVVVEADSTSKAEQLYVDGEAQGFNHTFIEDEVLNITEYEPGEVRHDESGE